MRHLVFTNQNIWAQTSWTKEKYVEKKSVGRREAYYNKYQCKLPNQWRTHCVKSRDNLKSIIFFPLRYHFYNTGDRFTSVRVIVSKKYFLKSGPLSSNIMITLEPSNNLIQKHELKAWHATLICKYHLFLLASI